VGESARFDRNAAAEADRGVDGGPKVGHLPDSIRDICPGERAEMPRALVSG
jgi:hypothetical protein